MIYYNCSSFRSTFSAGGIAGSKNSPSAFFPSLSYTTREGSRLSRWVFYFHDLAYAVAGGWINPTHGRGLGNRLPISRTLIPNHRPRCRAIRKILLRSDWYTDRLTHPSYTAQLCSSRKNGYGRNLPTLPAVSNTPIARVRCQTRTIYA